MEKIFLNQNQGNLLDSKFGDLKPGKSLIKKALNFTGELPLFLTESKARNYKEAFEEWVTSDNDTEKERVTILRRIKFAFEEKSEAKLLNDYENAEGANFEFGQVLVIRKLAEMIIEEGK
jgi:hypothetical protein